MDIFEYFVLSTVNQLLLKSVRINKDASNEISSKNDASYFSKLFDGIILWGQKESFLEIRC